MITKGIIEANVNSLSPDYSSLDTKYIVRLPIFEGTGKSSDATVKAICAVPAGTTPDYQPGDVVFVTFEDNCFNHPVIIGKLYTGDGENSKTFSELVVTDSASLPLDTTIGNVEFASLVEQLNNIGPSGAAVWGSITGDISNQYDLMAKFSQYAETSSLASVAFSGDYNDLSNQPTIPSDTADLTNGAGFITSAAINGLVPYSGASGDVNLGNNTLYAADIGSQYDGDFMGMHFSGDALYLQNQTSQGQTFVDVNELSVTVGSNYNLSAIGGINFSASNFYFNGNAVLTYADLTYHSPDYATGLKIATGHNVSDMYVPAATSTQAGIITTGSQVFAGEKVFVDRPKSREIYTELEYLESSAPATNFPYIRTGVKKGIEYSTALTCVMDGYFTTSQTLGFNGYDAGGQLGQSNGKWSTEAGNSNVQCVGSANRATVTQVLNFTTLKDTLYISGSQIAQRAINTASTYATQGEYPLFVAYNGTYAYKPAAERIYSFKMYSGDYQNDPDNAVLIRDFIPARAANGQVGMLDLVENKFYPNQGVTDFIVGNDVQEIAVDTNLLTSGDVAIVALTNNYNDLDNKPTSMNPTAHASTATTYGAGTSSKYGHVKLVTGDVDSQTYTDGIAAAAAHTHSSYVTQNALNTELYIWGSSIYAQTLSEANAYTASAISSANSYAEYVAALAYASAISTVSSTLSSYVTQNALNTELYIWGSSIWAQAVSDAESFTKGYVSGAYNSAFWTSIQIGSIERYIPQPFNSALNLSLDGTSIGTYYPSSGATINIDLSASGYNKVIANPILATTDTLNNIYIGGVNYAIPGATGTFVPYTGASKDVNISTHSLIADGFYFYSASFSSGSISGYDAGLYYEGPSDRLWITNFAGYISMYAAGQIYLHNASGGMVFNASSGNINLLVDSTHKAYYGSTVASNEIATIGTLNEYGLYQGASGNVLLTTNSSYGAGIYISTFSGPVSVDAPELLFNGEQVLTSADMSTYATMSYVSDYVDNRHTMYNTDSLSDANIDRVLIAGGIVILEDSSPLADLSLAMTPTIINNKGLNLSPNNSIDNINSLGDRGLSLTIENSIN